MMCPNAYPAETACFLLVYRPAFAYNSTQQHPPRLSTMRTRGVTFSGYSPALKFTSTPVLSHTSGRSGDFFMPGVCS